MKKVGVCLLAMALLVGCNKGDDTKASPTIKYKELTIVNNSGDDIIKEVQLQTIPFNREKTDFGYRFYFTDEGLDITISVFDITYSNDLDDVKNNLKYILWKDGVSKDKIKSDTLNFSDVKGIGVYGYKQNDKYYTLKYNSYLTNGVMSKIIIKCKKDLASKEDLRMLVLGDIVKMLKTIKWEKDIMR